MEIGKFYKVHEYIKYLLKEFCFNTTGQWTLIRLRASARNLNKADTTGNTEVCVNNTYKTGCSGLLTGTFGSFEWRTAGMQEE